MTPPLSLVVLAAGLGTRFGGPKQLEPLGPDGSTLMDFSVFDAWRAGFGRVVFVIRPDLALLFERTIVGRYRGRLEIATVFQRLDDLPGGVTRPAGRTRPWGTTHALLAARAELPGPFAVLNADDFYGQDALAAVASFLGRPNPDPNRHAVVGYRLDATASEAGGVNRAVLEAAPNGTLARIVEVLGLVREPDGRFLGRDGSAARRYEHDTLVSMNLWGFQRSILPVLERGFARFLGENPGERTEYLLPSAIQDAMTEGASVLVLRSGGRWCGVTYPDDREPVRRTLASLVAAGAYPDVLWR